MADHRTDKGADILPLILNLGTRRTDFSYVRLKIADAFIEGLKACEVEDDDQFVAYMKAASSFFVLDLTQREIASGVGVTVMTFQRWINGQHLPYPQSRRTIVAALIELVESKRRQSLPQDRAKASLLCFPG